MEQIQSLRKFPEWMVVIPSAVISALVAGMGTYFMTIKSQPVVKILPNPTPTAAIQKIPTATIAVPTNEPTTKTSTSGANDSYTVGNITLSYSVNPKLEYSDQYVTVYISEGGVKREIIHQFPIDVAGGGMPKFNKTAKANIVLLTTVMGDLGGIVRTYGFIDVMVNKTVQVSDATGQLTVIDAYNKESIIQLSITDECGDGEKRKLGMTAILHGLTLNDQLQNVGQSRTLKCINEQPFGPYYSPLPNITYTGISTDLAKVFFSLEGDSWDSNDNVAVAWRNNISFDVAGKSIKEEEPVNLLTYTLDWTGF